jgi:type I restriction enzyme S subunit
MGAIRLRIAENNPAVSPEFLSHVFANPASIQWFKFHAIGATMPNLNEGIIRAFPLLLPSIEEQSGISGLLGDLDEIIAINCRVNETLEHMTRAVFDDWFVDFCPTRAKLNGREQYLSQDLWQLFPDRLAPQGIPEGWRLVTLG